MASPIPIIDSHIHLFTKAQLDTLAWCNPSHPLAGDHTVEEFKAAAASALSPSDTSIDTITSSVSTSTATILPTHLVGFIYLETDRKNGESKDWTHPLSEISWIADVAASTFTSPASSTPRCLAIVPWAPLPLGPGKLAEYLRRAEEAAGPEAWARVRGFRYLLQDKPLGAGLADDFVGALRELGRRGFVFDVGVDQHRRGRAQLEECVEMIDRAHEGVPEEEKVVFVLNHLCKPDLTLFNTSDPSFIAWRTAMFTLGKCKQTYMKLSGCFSEMPDSLRSRPAEEIFESMYPWLAVVLAAFGPGRVMFGSDWPVCTVGVGAEAWEKWRRVVARTCYMASLGAEEQALIWNGTARKAYGIKDEL